MVNSSKLHNPTKQFQSILCVAFAFTLSASFWVFFFPPLLICQLLPISLFNYRLRKASFCIIGELIGIYLHTFISLLQLACGVTFLEYGDIPQINTSENALIISNHPTLFDWCYIWAFLSKYSSLHRLKVVLKQDMMYIPFLGACIQSAGYLFLARDFAKDSSTISSVIDYYNKYSDFYQVLIFPEGTNIGPHVLPKHEKYVKDHGLVETKETIIPRVTGFHFLLLQLTQLHYYFDYATLANPGTDSNAVSTSNGDPVSDDEKVAFLKKYDVTNINTMKKFVNLYSNIDAVYDFTIAYTPTRNSHQMSLHKGKAPQQCHVKLRRFDIVDAIEQIDAISLQNSPRYYTNNDKYNPYSLIDPASIEKYNKLNEITNFAELFKHKTEIWLTNLWYQKDAELNSFYTQVEEFYAKNPITTPSTVLLDPKKYFIDTHILSHYNIFHMLLSFITLAVTIVYGCATSNLIIALWLGVSVFTILLLTFFKYPLFKVIIEQNKNYEVQYGQNDNSPFGVNIYKTITTKPSIYDMLNLLKLQKEHNLIVMDDTATLNTAANVSKNPNIMALYTPRQIRVLGFKKDTSLSLRGIKSATEDTDNQHALITSTDDITQTVTISPSVDSSIVAPAQESPNYNNAANYANSQFAFTHAHYYTIVMIVFIYFLAKIW